MGPLELLYGWQALLCASACIGLTKLIKAIIDLSLSKEKRRANPWLNALVLPMVPVVLGAIYAVAIPLRPEVLLAYTKSQELEGFLLYLAYAGWGAACGQFATTLHGKLKDFLQARSA